ncbi:hypothetical protein [Winogradskyella sp.]|uniref:hypothetical protein n=1 Tax=Winogradskyella sp. TaxID=1883156 RepID=UPI0025F56CFF|nr:hypothetical protein [Winogradskyella sp.]
MRNSILICLIAVFTFGCDTDVPETDTTAPEFSLRIFNARFDHTFTQDDDLSNLTLRLKNDAGYRFTLTGVDNGGVRVIQWQLPADNSIAFDNEITSPWSIVNTSSIRRMIEWLGDRNNALTGAILDGKFRATGSQRQDTFSFLVSDFGGESGSYNTYFSQLNIYIGNWEAEVVEF